MNLEEIVIREKCARERREVELLGAFSDDRRRRDLVLRDCANLVACIGGYAVPFDSAERDKWLGEQWINDPTFHSKVEVLAALVNEYIDYARRSVHRSVREEWKQEP